MAVVGKGFAVLQSGKVHISGFLAWLAWAAVHLQFLAQSSLRVSVFVQWAWTYITGQRGSRLIVNHHGYERVEPVSAKASSQQANDFKVRIDRGEIRMATPTQTRPHVRFPSRMPTSIR